MTESNGSYFYRTTISPDVSLVRHKAILWTNAGILLIGPLGMKFSEILIEINIFSLKKMHLKTSSAKSRARGIGLKVLKPTNALTPRCDYLYRL